MASKTNSRQERKHFPRLRLVKPKVLKLSLTKRKSAVLWRQGAPLTLGALRSLTLSNHLLVFLPRDECSPWRHDVTHGELNLSIMSVLLWILKNLTPPRSWMNFQSISHRQGPGVLLHNTSFHTTIYTKSQSFRPAFTSSFQE